MRFKHLQQWLDWQQSLHWQEIELGLERVAAVAKNLSLNNIASTVITVAGTNGKGSTVALYSAFLQAAGLSVGCYTSPHLMRYNERIVINGIALDDATIMAAFEAIDQARGDISLSYFEFGTLAALYCFKQAQVDVAVLEVGLGGRLDAVNIIDADLLHFTPIGIDHTAWLGDTREQIGFEKAGVLRNKSLVICNDANPPKSLSSAISAHTKQALYLQKDYLCDVKQNVFIYGKKRIDISSLALQGMHQKSNCCGVLAGLALLKKQSLFQPSVVQSVLSGIQVKGRFETVAQNERFKTIIDVGHNEDAAKAIAAQLKSLPDLNCVLVLGMLQDKSVSQFCAQLKHQVAHCICIGLHGERALSAEDLQKQIDEDDFSSEIASDIGQAMSKAESYLLANQHHSVSSQPSHDIILLAGSFYTVEAYLKWSHSS